MSTIKVNSILKTNGDNLLGNMTGTWINFAQASDSIRESVNVSSLTNNGTGINTVNFSTTRADVNYCVSLSAGDRSSGGNTNGYGYGSWLRGTNQCNYATTSILIGLGYPANTSNYNNDHVNLSILGT